MSGPCGQAMDQCSNTATNQAQLNSGANVLYQSFHLRLFVLSFRKVRGRYPVLSLLLFQEIPIRGTCIQGTMTSARGHTLGGVCCNVKIVFCSQQHYKHGVRVCVEHRFDRVYEANCKRRWGGQLVRTSTHRTALGRYHLLSQVS